MKRRRADLAHLSSYSQEYKTAWMRKKRGSISWADYKDKVQARAANQKPCSIEGCGKKRCSKDYCAMHYWRWKRHGDPMVVRKPRDPEVKHCQNAQEYFSDLTPKQLEVTRDILKHLKCKRKLKPEKRDYTPLTKNEWDRVVEWAKEIEPEEVEQEDADEQLFLA